MVFSPDLTQIAIVFHGKPMPVWTLQISLSRYIPPKRCVCIEDNLFAERDAWNNPELVLWQPDAGHLLIQYEDTKIIGWNLADENQVQYVLRIGRVSVTIR
jgi:hypothetical protein